MMDLRLAYSTVNRLRGQIPQWLPFEDAEAAAILGLITAQQKNDPERDEAFSSFAVPHIRGSVFDESYRWKWFPKSDRDHTMSSLDEPFEDGDAPLDRLKAYDPGPEEQVMDREIIRRAIEALTPKERNMLRLHICDGYTLSEVGDLHGITKSTCEWWVKRALGKMQDALRQVGFEFDPRQKRCLNLEVEIKERVRELAETTDLSVRQICAEAGCKKGRTVCEIIREARAQ